LFFVCPQSIVENYLEVGGRGMCRVRLGHECKSGDWCVMKLSEASCFVDDRAEGNRSKGARG
jgi:hypothetical protein